jgi:hypothetical protein
VELDFVFGTVEPSLALLDSVDLSVRKLARDRLRRSFRKEGAMTDYKNSKSVSCRANVMQLSRDKLPGTLDERECAQSAEGRRYCP